MININIDVKPPFSVDNVLFTVNKAEAYKANDYQLVWRLCSDTGYHKVCKVNEFTECDVGAQTLCPL